MGIETYNKHCRGIVTRYSKEWERTIKRLGRWIDFENDYKTMVRTTKTAKPLKESSRCSRTSR